MVNMHPWHFYTKFSQFSSNVIHPMMIIAKVNSSGQTKPITKTLTCPGQPSCNFTIVRGDKMHALATTGDIVNRHKSPRIHVVMHWPTCTVRNVQSMPR